MDATELFEKITSEPKWYAGFMSPQNATMAKARFKEKTLSFETLSKIFNHFGYYLNASWERQEINDVKPLS